MGFFSNEFRSVIEWKDPPADVLIWRWDGSNDELKNASKLLVNPGQAAIFVYQGEVRAIHDYPGLFELRTANIPFWTTITKFMQGFTSEHKANIYFVRLTEFLNLKWGTKSPIKYDDPKYKFPVGLRAFGNFSFKIVDIRKFFTEVTSNRSVVTVNEVRNIFVERIMTPLTDLFAESGYSYSEIDRKRVELSEELRKRVADIFSALGFELTDFRIENTDFDEDTKRRINRIADQIAEAQAVKALGEVDGASMNNYTRVEQLKAVQSAAQTPGSLAGMGIGLGAGFGMGQGIAQAFQPVAGGSGAGGSSTAQNTVTCPNCRAQIDASAKFCPNCGKPNSIGKTQCVKCQALIDVSAKFCPECGAPQQSALCPSCHKPVAVGAKFCPECGYKIA